MITEVSQELFHAKCNEMYSESLKKSCVTDSFKYLSIFFVTRMISHITYCYTQTSGLHQR